MVALQEIQSDSRDTFYGWNQTRERLSKASVKGRDGRYQALGLLGEIKEPDLMNGHGHLETHNPKVGLFSQPAKLSLKIDIDKAEGKLNFVLLLSTL